MKTSQEVMVESIAYNVVVEGPKDGRLVVLVHALMANMHMWDSTTIALHGAGYRTLRYDHIGHNTTPPPLGHNPQRYHFDDLTRHLRSIHETACPGQQPFALIGCSIGGVLVLRYAMMFPGTAQKIICCSSPGVRTIHGSETKWRQRIKQFRADGAVDNLATGTVGRWFPDPCAAEIRAEALQMCKTCTLPGYEVHAECIMNYDYSDQVRQIQHEAVLLLAGDNDANIGPAENLVELSREIKGAMYVLMKDTGHIPSMHRPLEFEEIVLDFVNK